MPVAHYTRVSTSGYDASCQVEELHSFVNREFPDASTRKFVDVVADTASAGGEQYQALRQAITAGEIDAVVVHELSRFSRLSGG